MEIKLTNSQIVEDSIELIRKIKASGKKYGSIYPILRGGYYVALKLSRGLDIPLSDTIMKDTLIVDDLIDSGNTISCYPDNDIAVLYVKNNKAMEVDYFADEVEGWITFPWEQKDENEKNVSRLIQMIGDDISRPGLIDTPKRVVKMWSEIYKGYDEKKKPKITVFKNGTDGLHYDQMIVDSGRFYSVCEHHMVPFFGTYWFGYIPHVEGNIVGLSKVARIIDYYSSRLQVQERLGKNVVDTVWEALESPEPLGMGLVLQAEHLCKTMRGARKQGTMTTSYLRGAMKNKAEARSEFLEFIGITKN